MRSRGVITIARTNVRRAVGDRKMILLATVVPILLILVSGVLAGGVKVPLGVVNSASGPAATRLVTLLQRSSGLKVRLEANRATLNDDILRGRVVAGVVVPPGFTLKTAQGRTPQLNVVFVGQSAQTQVIQAHTDVVATLGLLSAEGQAGPSPAKAVHAQATTNVAQARVTRTASAPMSPFSYVGPADLVLFMGILVFILSSSLVESRKLGMLRRLLAAPVRSGAIVAGQLASLVLVALGQAVGLLVIGRLIFGVRWGDPLGVALIIVCLSFALAGASSLLGTMARSHEQAVAVGVVLAIAGGMLGGCMWPLSVVGPTMQAVGHLTPQAWAMDGFVKLVYGHQGVAAILPEALVLAGFAVVLCTLAAVKLRSTLVRLA